MKLALRHRSYLNKALLTVLFLFIFLIPLNKKVIPLLIVIWVLLWLINGSVKAKIKSLATSRIFFLLLIFYVLHLIGMLYTGNVPAGLFDLEIKFSLFLFPLIMLSEKEFFIKNKNRILFAFVLGNAAAAIACLLNSIFTAKENVFFYFQYTDFSLFHHPSYASMYALFSVCILFFFLFKNPFPGFTYYKAVYAILILILFAYIFFLSSRTGTMAVILVLGFWGMYSLFIRKKWWWLALAMAAILALPVLVVKFHPRFIPVARFINTPPDSLDISSGENVTIRYVVVRHSIALIKEDFFCGKGTGDVKDALMEMYRKKNIKAAIEQKINAHNQYIETFIGLGISGIISLMLLVLTPFWLGLSRQNILAVLFSLIVMINFFFESMLNTQAGVIFFAFFNTLFVFTFPVAGTGSGNQPQGQKFP